MMAGVIFILVAIFYSEKDPVRHDEAADPA